MVFLQLFRSLEGRKVQVELQNDVILQGTLQSVDHFYNFRLTEIEVINPAGCPQLCTITAAFIRGARIRYIQLPKEDVDLDLLHDATRRHNQGTQ
jgi:U6 snRNA-associated Sm-like protein LSm2